MVMYKRLLFIFTLINICTVSMVQAGAEHLLPKPQKYTAKKGSFALSKTRLTSSVLPEEWKAFITERGGTIDDKVRANIEVKLLPSLSGVTLNQDEAYHLVVGSNKILIEAVTERGVYWAMQTLAQLQNTQGKKVSFEACEITDWPAFRIRGFMQDVGRSYISVEELKREIDMMTRFKMNVFHWHLTENQSWRLESKLFPMLNDSINTTRMPGKYYTLEEARDLVAYCKARNIMLIPEFDMPGHSAAFMRTFRHDMQSPEGMKILKLLMEEVCEVFDVPYIHIGTDEVKFTNPTFVPEMVAYVRSLGKKTISWNPGWKYQPGEIDMLHLWSSRGKAHPGIPAIDSRLHYLNHFDTFGDIVALYNSRICDVEQGSDDIAGTIIAIWHDRLVEKEWNMILENNLYPNMLAIAERAWLGGGTEYFNKYGTILSPEDTDEFKAFVNFEKRMLWHKDHTFKGYPFGYVKQTHIKWNITDAFPNGGDLTKVFPPEEELKTSYQYEGVNYNVRPATGAGIYLRHVWGATVSAFYKEPKENHTAYAYTWVYSPKEQEVGLWAETQNYGRSEMDLSPPQGKWDFRESRFWINDQEILPPTWTATHQEKSYEIALGNNNMLARDPIPVHLKKGWNKVLIKLPIDKFSIPQVRLSKWMFSAVFVTKDGRNGIEGLIYSPEKKM